MAAPANMEAETAAEFLKLTQNDPRTFADTAYPWGQPNTPFEEYKELRAWQAAELDALTAHLQDPKTVHVPYRTSIASGHGIGKSALIAILIHWGICTMTNAKGVITANTESQLRTKTWPEMRKWYNSLVVRDFFRVDNTVFRANDKENEMTWRLDAAPWSLNNTEAFAGLHNKNKRILLLMDEASAIADDIWEVSEGAMTDEDTQIIWVAFGNPTRPSGRFYLTHNLHRHRWRHKQIDSRNVEGTNKRQLQEWVDDYGEDSDFVRVRVRGQFPRSGSNQLIATDVVQSACERDVAPRIQEPLIFGVDVARFGDDQSVLYTRKGNAGGVRGVFKWRGLDNVQLADKVAEKIIELTPHHVNIDGGGPGGGVIDILRDRGYVVHEVKFGGASTNEDMLNKRAEIWCRMRDWLKAGGSIDWSDNDLQTELTQQTYHYSENKQNALCLTPKAVMKKDGLPSPDTADALACTFAQLVSPVTTSEPVTGLVADVEHEYEHGWE